MGNNIKIIRVYCATSTTGRKEKEMTNEWDDVYSKACDVSDQRDKLNKQFDKLNKQVDNLVDFIEYKLEEQKYGIKPSVKEVIHEIHRQKYSDLKEDLKIIRQLQELNIIPTSYEGYN